MKLHLQATPSELIEKGEQLIQSIGDILRPLSPDLADALAKALPQKENELKFPVLVELQKKTEAEYARQMELMLRDIDKVLHSGIKKSDSEPEEITYFYFDKALNDYCELDDLHKAGGPYIGPRGGKWADPQHTIHWEPENFGVHAHIKLPEKLEPIKERYGDKEARGVLSEMGEALYHVQSGQHYVQDDTGLNHYDYSNWPKVFGDLNGMRRMLKKYKRQISNTFGEDEYYKCGLSDPTGATGVTPEYHPTFGSLQLPVNGLIEKPKFGAYLAIQKKHGARFNGDSKTWYVPKNDLDKFDFEAYRFDMEKLGLAVAPIKGEPHKVKKDVEKEGSGASVDLTPKQIIDGIRTGQIRNTILVYKHADGVFSFHAPYSTAFNDIFSNRTGILSGITKYNPVDKGRETFDLDLVEEALDKLKATFPDWTIIAKDVKEARIARDQELAELRKPIPEVQKKLDSKFQLFPYQNEAVKFLDKANGNALIGDEMGLGKTLETLAWVAKNNKKVLVVCPPVVRRTWLQEAHKFFPDHFKGAELIARDIKRGAVPDLKAVNIATVNYESLYKFESQIKDAGFDTIIVDESHRMKNPKARQTKSIQRVAADVKHKILLSGTAIKNKKDELFTQLDLVAPGRFPKYELQGSTIGGLWLKMSDVYLARLKQNVLKDLPEQLTSVIKQPIDDLPDVKGSIDIGDIARLKAEVAKGKTVATKDLVDEILESSDSKVLVFTDSKEAAEKLAHDYGDQAILHHGGQSFNAREAAKEEWQRTNDAGEFISPKRVFITTRQSMAVGATLTAADKVVFNDLPWTAADLRQAESRAHRHGQRNTVNVYWVTAEGNLFDENVTSILLRKYELGKKINQGKQLTPEERAWMEKPITATELMSQIRGATTGPEPLESSSSDSAVEPVKTPVVEAPSEPVKPPVVTPVTTPVVERIETTKEVIREPVKEPVKEEPKGQLSLFKSALFIGPRGGRWADAQHTISYKEETSPRQVSGKVDTSKQLTLDFTAKPIEPVKEVAKPEPPLSELPDKEIKARAKKAKVDLWGHKITKETIDQIRTDMRQMTKLYKAIKIPEESRFGEGGWGFKPGEKEKWLDEYWEARKAFGTFHNNIQDWAYNWLVGEKEMSYSADQVRKSFWVLDTEMRSMFPEAWNYKTDKHEPSTGYMKKDGLKAMGRMQAKIRKALQAAERYVADAGGAIERDPLTHDFQQDSVTYKIYGRSLTPDRKEDIEEALNTVHRTQNKLKTLGLGKALEGLTVHVHSERPPTVEQRTSGGGRMDDLVAGWYNYVHDELRLFPLGHGRADSHDTLIHEIGHRLYFKSLSERAREQWNETIKQNRKQVTREHINEFIDKFVSTNTEDRSTPDKSKLQVVYHKVQDAVAKDTSENKPIYEHFARNMPYYDEAGSPEGMRDHFHKYFEDIGSEYVNREYITDYAATSPVEAFAEIFRLYVKYGPGYVPPWSREQFRSILKSNNVNLTKSLEDDEDVEKAALFIGPRGGRWADAMHTIPYHDLEVEKHYHTAAELLQQSDSLDDAISSVRSMRKFQSTLDIGGKDVPIDELIERLESFRPKPIPENKKTITVYHSTDRATANRILKDGYIPASKPTNLARQRWEEGGHAEFAPGRGVSGGIYVGSGKGSGVTEGFGRVTLKLDIPEDWLHVPPEQKVLGVKDPGVALNTADGAVIHEPIHPSAISEIGAPVSATSKNIPVAKQKESGNAGRARSVLDDILGSPKGEEKFNSIDTGKFTVDVFKGDSEEDHKLIQDSIKKFSKVITEHLGKNMPSIRIVVMPGAARYVHDGSQASYDTHYKHIKITTKAGHGTLFHEYAHFLDHCLGNLKEKDVNSAMSSHREAGVVSRFTNQIKDTDSFRAWKESRKDLSNDVHKKYYEYITQPTEMFARFFDQWFNKKLGNNQIAERYAETGGVFSDKDLDELTPQFEKIIREVNALFSMDKQLIDLHKADDSPDYTQDIVAKEEKTYEQVKQELIGRGYFDTDFEVGGPLYGMSTNELIDMIRDKRND